MAAAKILIVDDEKEICLYIKDIFGFEGFDADYVTTAKDAFQKIERDGYGLILIDIKLEGPVSGIEIIKSFRKSTKRPKIIVISAIPQAALQTVLQKEDVLDLIGAYLDKPGCCNPEKLTQIVRELLR